LNQSHAPASLTSAEENRVIWLVVAVQFIHMVDFVMVMPLGPDFARTINMDASAIGIVGGVFTLAAAVSALAVYRFLDRFNRRQSLLLAMIALAVTTATTGLAWSYQSLLIFRVLAGLAAGPVTALALATITDGVAVERRGRAFGPCCYYFCILYGVCRGACCAIANVVEHGAGTGSASRLYGIAVGNAESWRWNRISGIQYDGS